MLIWSIYVGQELGRNEGEMRRRPYITGFYHILAFLKHGERAIYRME